VLALVVAEGIAVALLAVLVAGLLRSHAEILRALHDLGASLDPDQRPPGPVDVDLQVRPGVTRPRGVTTPAYDVSGATPDGDAVALGLVGAPEPTLLAFLSSGCATCASFWSALAADAVPGGARVVIVAKDAAEESPSRLRELAPASVPVVLSTQAWEDYAVPASPYFVLVDGPAGRVVGEGSATTWPQVADLIRQADDDAGSGGTREARDDADLLAAGIGPGHPSLYAQPPAGD
jgi:hypothetical protein